MKLECPYDDMAPRTEMIPLMDCVFLILVFFVYAMLTMVVHHGLDVDLPEAGTAEVGQDRHVTISIDADNKIAVQDQVVTMEGLVSAVKRSRESDEMPIYISADKKSDSGVMIEVFDSLRAAGIKIVNIRTREKQE